MRLLRLLSVTVLACAMGLISADAQSFRNSKGPAETPPASFKGKQYVDSRGCVFIRAGYGGQVTWVPRVTRDRKQVCGARSTAQPVARTAKAAPRSQDKVVRGKPPANAQVISRTVKVVKPKAAPAPKAQPRVVRRQVQAPKVQTRVVRQQQPQTQTRVVRRQVAAPQTRVVRQQVTAPQQKVVRRQAAPQPQPKVVYRCAGVSEFSSQFVNKGARCGPQSGASRSIVREELSPQSSNTRGGQLAGPKGVNRKIAESRIPAPKGYKKAWDDGRLNPLRGTGTTSGKGQMSLVWSNTVPRYLIDPATGKRATAKQKRVLGIF